LKFFEAVKAMTGLTQVCAARKVGTLLAPAASGERKQFSHPPVPAAVR
jgi:hypothetical protein